MQIPIRSLLFVSALYLLSPFCLFLVGWIHPLVGVFFMIALLLVLLKGLAGVTGTIFFTRKSLIIGGIILAVWTILSGAGHRGFFDGDFYKHNAILSDLISYNWPVTYHLTETGQFVHLVYYFAYYLPSALVGKFLGWKAANIMLIFWTMGGISIVYLWLLSVVREKMQVWYIFLFPLFSGLDGVGRLIMGNKIVNFTDWEWWGRNWQYSGNTTLFFYVPQQALAGWICMGILTYCFLKNKKLPLQELFFVSTLLWSPFVFIGLTPFYIWMFIAKKIKCEIIPMTFTFFIFLIQVLFFLASMTLSYRETSANAWFWQIESLLHSFALVRLTIFYILEFGIFVMLLIKVKKTPSLLIIACVILFAIPWYKMGLLNDFAMRASIPALFVISVFWLMFLLETKKSTAVLIISWIIFIIGSMYPFILLQNGIVHFSFGPPRYSLSTLDQPKFRRQYLGSNNSLFFQIFRPLNIGQNVGSLSIQK